MGENDMGGKKSGGGGRTPHEAPDSLKSAQRLRAVGLISLGPIKGPVNKWKSTYFDNTPIQNENGVDDNDTASFNFKNTEIQFTLGTQDQAPLKGFEMSEREVAVNAEVKKQSPITRTVTDPDVTRIRLTLGVNALYYQNNQGDTNGTNVEFKILINGTARKTFSISGKSSSRFFRSYIIDDLPPRPFNITVQRLTDDSKSQRLQNATNWASYTEIIDTKLSYPNMALVGIKTDSRYNPNFPNVNFLLYGRIVKVPSTYDPENRTYAAGIWKGDWKDAWTNNPAWVFYDLVTDPLAGLGKRVSDYGLDKFQLYQIAKYCDELVDDGFGGKEPRMTANMWITEQRNAYDVVSDMASVFRAIAVWTGTQFTAIQDRPTDPVCIYNQSNVINGKFTRQYAALKSIFTAAEVEYADERNMYQSAVEYVADDLMIARYGYNSKKMTAFATTTRGQAHRWGKWVLATSLLEQCTITFSVGRQGLMHLPGDIIEIADNDFAGKPIGGRVIAINGNVVTLDQPVEINGDSYLSYLNEEMKIVKIKISKVDNQNKAVIHLESEPMGLDVNDDWVLKTSSVSTQLYRAVGITENEDGSYTITALQHEPQKEAIVDGSASFVPVATTAYTSGLSAVQNAEISSDTNGILLTFTSPSFVGQGLKYQVKLYRNGKFYEIYDDLPEPRLAFADLPDGNYIAEIRAKNGVGQLSEPTTTNFTVSFTLTELVATPKIFAIDLNWKNPLFAKPNSAIEIWVSSDNNFQNARKLVSLAYPTNHYSYTGLSQSDRFWFWARMSDGITAGQFTDPVEGIPEQNATLLTEYLDGQITETQLGKSLINSLQQNINSAVNKEAKIRQQAVSNVQANLTAYQATQANKEQTVATQLNGLTTRLNSAEGNISSIQSTKANKNEVASIAQNSLQSVWRADAQAKVDALSVGGRNLILDSKRLITSGKVNFNISQNIDYENIKHLAISCDVKYTNAVMATGNNKKWFRVGAECRMVFTDGSYQYLGLWKIMNGVPSSFSGRISRFVPAPVGKTIKLIDFVSIQIHDINADSISVSNPKLELGTVATDWTPAPEDVDGAINAISSKVDSVQQTLTTANQALGSRIDTVTASINDAKSQVSQVSKVVSDVSGKLSATHTLKTQVIGGGKTAIAGIALGATADNKTKEASVIVMADKFGVVKNASDGNVVSMFSMVNNKVAVNGDLIADGSILGKHIKAAQTLTSPNINGGTITGNTIKGGTITGTTVNGGTITGTTINGGVIKGARMEAVVLEVENLIGGGIFENKFINEVRRSGRSNYEMMATVKIKARKMTRLVTAFSRALLLPFTQEKNLAKHSISQVVVIGIPIQIIAGGLVVPANKACTLEFRVFPEDIGSNYMGNEKARLAAEATLRISSQIISDAEYIEEVKV